MPQLLERPDDLIPVGPVDEELPTPPERISVRPRPLRARAITIVVLAAAGFAVLLAVPGLRQILVDVRHMGTGWLILAIILELASCLSFVVIFRHFFDRLPARLASELAWAEMGSGALLPGGGLGSLAAGGWLLHLVGMPTSRILRRSSGLFFLTSATNVIALIAGGLLLLGGLTSADHSLLLGAPPVAAGLLAAGGAISLPLLMRRHHPKLSRRFWWLTDLVAGIGEAEHALLRPSWRLLGAIGYLGFDIGVLWVTLHAVGYTAPLATLILGYIIGYLANLIPIPGGVGVLEGGLVGTLILYGAPATQTTAAVLVYHAIAFWIPSLGGLWAYRQIQQTLSAHQPDVEEASLSSPKAPAHAHVPPRRSYAQATADKRPPSSISTRDPLRTATPVPDKAGALARILRQAGIDGDLETRDTPLGRGTPRSWHDRRSTPMS